MVKSKLLRDTSRSWSVLFMEQETSKEVDGIIIGREVDGRSAIQAVGETPARLRLQAQERMHFLILNS